jgi:hypothetical protein
MMYDQYGLVAQAKLRGASGDMLTGSVSVVHVRPGATLELVLDVWNGRTGVYGVHLVEGQACDRLLAPKEPRELDPAAVEYEPEAYDQLGTPIANLKVSAAGRGHLEASIAPFQATEASMRTILGMSVFIRRIDVSGGLVEHFGCADLTAVAQQPARAARHVH